MLRILRASKIAHFKLLQTQPIFTLYTWVQVKNLLLPKKPDVFIFKNVIADNLSNLVIIGLVLCEDFLDQYYRN